MVSKKVHVLVAQKRVKQVHIWDLNINKIQNRSKTQTQKSTENGNKN